MPPRKKTGEPMILEHTSIRLHNGGGVLLTGDEDRLQQLLPKEELDRLQNQAGAIAGFVPVKKGAADPPAQLPKTNAGTAIETPPDQQD